MIKIYCGIVSKSLTRTGLSGGTMRNMGQRDLGEISQGSCHVRQEHEYRNGC